MDRHDEGEAFVAIDRSVVAGRTYFYRLTSRNADGELLTFGPISAAAGVPITEFAISSVSPNPTRGRTLFEYTVAREAPARLSILDIAGREVAVLADGVTRPGRYQAVWSGETGPGSQAPAGVYLVRLSAPGKQLTRRFALAP